MVDPLLEEQHLRQHIRTLLTNVVQQSAFKPIEHSQSADGNQLQELLLSLNSVTVDQEQWSAKLQEGIDIILGNPSLTNSLEKMAANAQFVDDVAQLPVDGAAAAADAKQLPVAAAAGG